MSSNNKGRLRYTVEIKAVHKYTLYFKKAFDIDDIDRYLNINVFNIHVRIRVSTLLERIEK